MPVTFPASMPRRLLVQVAHLPDGRDAVLPLKVDSIKYFCPNASALDGQELVPALKNLVQTVDGVLQSFARLVASRAPQQFSG
jgi:hypothetical protein